MHTYFQHNDHDTFYLSFLSSIFLSFSCTIDPPEVMVFPPVDDVLIGNSSSFMCKVTSTVEYTLSWNFKGSPQLPEGVLVNNTVLEIPSAQPSHSGMYSCQADDQVNVQSFEAVLVVNCELSSNISTF